jgi:hypothetical protein
MTQLERDKELLESFCDYWSLRLGQGIARFLESNEYREIPQPEASIPVSKIQKRIDELRNELNDDGVLSYTNQDQIEILTKLLEK